MSKSARECGGGVVDGRVSDCEGQPLRSAGTSEPTESREVAHGCGGGAVDGRASDCEGERPRCARPSEPTEGGEFAAGGGGGAVPTEPTESGGEGGDCESVRVASAGPSPASGIGVELPDVCCGYLPSRATIIDFGLARCFSRQVRPLGGAFARLAPERLSAT